MQHDFEICDDVAPAPARHPGLHSCPLPPDVLEAPNQHRQYLNVLDMIESIEKTPVPKIENIENDDAPQPAARHPIAKLVEERP